MPAAYYNEFEPYAADWIRNLSAAGEITKGIVDDRSITEVTADDVSGYQRVHFFAGIGGWEEALRLAEWPAERPIWTGSCPCQPFSSAGKRKGSDDERHLWPEMFRLIRDCRPVTVVGEQVASAVGHGWLDGVFADLETEGYACGAVVLGAHSVGSPHIRQRLFWVADTTMPRRAGQERHSESQARDEARVQLSCADGEVDRVAESQSDGRNQGRPESNGRQPSSGCESSRLVQSSESRLQGHAAHGNNGHQSGRINQDTHGPAATTGAWDQFAIAHCRDGKARRVPLPESGVQPLADGIPRKLGSVLTGVDRVAERAARTSRVGRLKGYGNAIVPQVAAEFLVAILPAE